MPIIISGISPCGAIPGWAIIPSPTFSWAIIPASGAIIYPPDYLRDAADHNVLATVHCEAEWDRTDQVGETRWISAISERHGFPNAIVAHAWFHTPEAAEVLAQQAAFPLVRGIRSKPVTTASPSEKPAGGPGTMRDEAWLTGLSRLAQYDLSYDLRVPWWHLDEAAAVARQFPHIPMVLNHTGFPWDRSEEGLAAWRKAMETIAREPNVQVKISEFGLKDQSWGYDFQPPHRPRGPFHLRPRTGDLRHQFSGGGPSPRLWRTGARGGADGGRSAARRPRSPVLAQCGALLPP